MCLARTRHTFGLFCCLLETLLLSGSIHGFVALIPLLQRDGVYFDACRNVSHPLRQTSELQLSVLYHFDCTALWTLNDEVYRFFRCENEERTFTLIFTVAVFATSFLMPFFGWIYDRFGTWIVRIIAIVMLIIGNMMAAFADRVLSDLLWPAMLFTALGGLIVFMTNIQLSNTFYTKRSIWIGVYVALYFISSGVYLGIKAAADHLDIARRYLFFIILAATILPISTTFCFHPITQVTENAYDLALFTCDSHIKMNSKKIHRETLAREDEQADKFWMKDRKVDGVLCSLSFMLHAFWFAALQGQCWVLTSLRYTLVPITEKDVYLERRDEVFCYLQLGMGLVAIFLGLLTDTQRWRVVKDFIEGETFHVKACIFAVVLTTLPAGVLSGVVFIPYAHILYLVDTLILMIRVMSWTTSCLFLFQVFPQKYFGRLWGTCQCLGALFGISYLPVQILHGELSGADGHNNHAYIKLGVATAILLSLSHPIHLLVRIRRLERASINAHPVGHSSPSPDDIIFLPVEEIRKAQAERNLNSSFGQMLTIEHMNKDLDKGAEPVTMGTSGSGKSSVTRTSDEASTKF